jgi:hypothetical protein
VELTKKPSEHVLDDFLARTRESRMKVEDEEETILVRRIK